VKIALAQINPTIGIFSGNLERLSRSPAALADQGARLTVFSELVICRLPACRFP